MKKYSTELKWAIIYFIIYLLWMALEKSMGWHGESIEKHPIYSMLFFVVAIVVFVFALLDKRSELKTMTWTQGATSGVVMSIIIAVFSPLSQYIVHNIISPEYFPNAIQAAVSNGRMTQEQAEAFFNYGSYVLQDAGGSLIFNIIFVAVVAYFLKNK